MSLCRKITNESCMECLPKGSVEQERISFMSRGYSVGLGLTLNLLTGHQETEEDEALSST